MSAIFNEMLNMESVANYCGISHLFHMTHIYNLESIFANGLLAHANPYQVMNISNQEVNCRRSANDPIYHRSIHSYVPFYYNPRNAMLYSAQRNFGHAVVLLAYDLNLLENALVTNKNASCHDTQFSANYRDLTALNWGRIYSRHWHQDHQLKKEMMAEALILNPVATERLQYVVCRGNDVAAFLCRELTIPLHVQVVVEPSLFF